MNRGRKTVEIDLPELEAAEMAARAAMVGAQTAEFMGIQALKGFAGAMHPEVVAFETRANQGRSGTKKDDGRQG